MCDDPNRDPWLVYFFRRHPELREDMERATVREIRERYQRALQDDIDTRLNEEANGWSELAGG